MYSLKIFTRNFVQVCAVLVLDTSLLKKLFSVYLGLIQINSLASFPSQESTAHFTYQKPIFLQ